MNISGLEGSKWWGKNFFDAAVEGVPKLAKQAGHEMTIHTLGDREWTRWVEISGKPIWEQWVKGCESKGLTEARNILNAAVEMLKSARVFIKHSWVCHCGEQGDETTTRNGNPRALPDSSVA